MSDFDMMGLAPRLLTALKDQGITEPTPIQTRAIPLVMQGRDVMGLAQTGTGKTAAFGLPLIHQLMGIGTKPNPKSARSLILAPTRELVNQINDTLFSYMKGTHLKIASVVGGMSINVQIKRLERGTDILVATPGRLLDLVDRKALTLQDTNFLVLDEADQMLDMGFIHALRRIAPLLGTPRQTLCFSATMNKLMNEVAQAYLNNPVRVEVAPPGKVADKVEQEVHFMNQAAKPDKLKWLLSKHPDDMALVFGRTKHGCERLMKALVAAGFKAGSIHGNKSQSQRDRTLDAFRAGDLKVLVATDVAARGIDIPGVRYVYNYELPNVPENYVHRIGRTARAGRDGMAVAFCAPEEFAELRDIEKVMGVSIRVASGDAPENFAAATAARKAAGNRGRGGARGGQGGDRGQSAGGAPKASKSRNAGGRRGAPAKAEGGLAEFAAYDGTRPAKPAGRGGAKPQGAGNARFGNAEGGEKRAPRKPDNAREYAQELTRGDGGNSHGGASAKPKKPKVNNPPRRKGQKQAPEGTSARGGPRAKAEQPNYGRYFD